MRFFPFIFAALLSCSVAFGATISAGAGPTIDLSAPGAIGGTTPGTGAFTTISSSGIASLNTVDCATITNGPGGSVTGAIGNASDYFATAHIWTVNCAATNIADNGSLVFLGATGNIISNANLIELRNGTSAQTFNLYGNGLSATDYARLTITSNGTDRFIIQSQKGGAGFSSYLSLIAQSGLLLGGSGSTQWQIAGGAFTPTTDNQRQLGTASFGISAVYLSKTTTTAGTTGNQTINKSSGTVNFAAAASTLTVTSSVASGTTYNVLAMVQTGDTTAYVKNVVKSNGSFVITLGAAATAETSVFFLILP